MSRVVLSGLRADLRRVLAAAIAIVLGVAFFAATLVLGDSMRAGFRDSFVAGNDGLAAVVRSAARLGNDDAGFDPGTVPVELAERLRTVDGVAAAAIAVEGRAQILDPDGRPIGGDGPPTLAGNWIDDERLSPWDLAEGRAPAASDEVVIDRASARRAGYEVGDTATIRTPDPRTVTVVGVATFAGADSQGPVTHVLFDTATAQDLFLMRRDVATSLRLAAEPGVDEDELVDRIEPLLDESLEALTGSALSAEQLAELESDFLGFFRTMLTGFAVIGLVVAVLTIHNTFAILVAQRSRQAALLRAIGATRRQVLGAVTAESLLVGVVASAAGVSAGIGLAALALAGMDAAGFGAPGSMQWSLTSLALAWTVGVVATLAASVLPAVHASRVPPLAATRELAVDRSGVSRSRVVVGAGLGLVAIATVAVAVTGDPGSPALGALGVLAGVAALVVAGPILARPVATTLGWPIARLRGRVGVLAQRNAVRNPRRTASTASSLMIGVAVVVFFATVAQSLTGYIERTVDAQFGGDLVIEQDSFSGPGLSRALPDRLAELDETAEVVPLLGGALRAGERTLYPTITDVAALDRLVDLDVTSGDVRALGDTGLAVSDHLATDLGWSTGDVVELQISGTPVELTVGAVYRARDLAGDLLLPTGAWERYGPPVAPYVVMIGLAPGIDLDAGRAAVAAVAADESAPAPLDRDDFVDTASAEIDQIIAVIVALLAVAVVIAVMGIGNTMSLSVHERTRELGLLRALGTGRSSVRAAVRWESVIVATFGSVLGLGLGTLGAWVTVDVVSGTESIDVSLAVPVTTFAVITLLGAAAGVLAGLRPARRASRVDVLAALATA
jgi:putative ABC transport system permease protein